MLSVKKTITTVHTQNQGSVAVMRLVESRGRSIKQAEMDHLGLWSAFVLTLVSINSFKARQEGSSLEGN